MEISKDTIAKLSHLARLSVPDQDLDGLQQDCSQILDFFNKINEIDTENIEPLYNILDRVNQFRPDTPKECLTPEVALSNAPAKDQDLILVPQVIE